MSDNAWHAAPAEIRGHVRTHLDFVALRMLGMASTQDAAELPPDLPRLGPLAVIAAGYPRLAVRGWRRALGLVRGKMSLWGVCHVFGNPQRHVLSSGRSEVKEPFPLAGVDAYHWSDGLVVAATHGELALLRDVDAIRQWQQPARTEIFHVIDLRWERSEAAWAAFEAGHVDCLEYLLTRVPTSALLENNAVRFEAHREKAGRAAQEYAWVLGRAAHRGDLAVVRFLYQRLRAENLAPAEQLLTRIASRAIAGNNWPCYAFAVVEHGLALDDTLRADALGSSNLDIWAHAASVTRA